MLNVIPGSDGEETNGSVVLSVDRYDELIGLESRVEAMMDLYRICGSIEIEDIFALLGYTHDARHKIANDKEETERIHYEAVLRKPDIYDESEVKKAKKWMEDKGENS